MQIQILSLRPQFATKSLRRSNQQVCMAHFLQNLVEKALDRSKQNFNAIWKKNMWLSYAKEIV